MLHRESPEGARRNIGFFADLDRLDRRTIDDFQLQALRSILHLARTHSKYYGAALPAAELVSIESVKTLPILTGDVLANLSLPNSDLLCGKQEGVVLRSGGTSGKSKIVVQPPAASQIAMPVATRGILAATTFRPSRVINDLPAGNLWGGFLLGHGVCENLGALEYPVAWRMGSTETIRMIEEHQIDTLLATPDRISELFLTAQLESSQLSSVKQIFYIGGHLAERTRKIISELKNPPRVHSLAYGSNETGPIGYQCPYSEGGVHHIHEDHVYVEILKLDSAEACSFDEVGDIVVTTLHNDLMPLIRYRLGDRAKWISGRCECASATRRIELLGRSGLSVRIQGVFITADELCLAINTVGNYSPEDLQICINAEANGVSVEVRVNAEKATADDFQKISALLFESAGISVLSKTSGVIEVRVSRISRSDFYRNSGSGKIPFVIELGS